MDSKEAHPVSEASSGSFTSSFTYADIVENSSRLKKDVDLSDNNDDNSRINSKGAVSEDEGYLSGYEELESELNKPVLDEAVTADNPASVKTDSFPVSEVIVSGGDGVEEEDKDTQSEIVAKSHEVVGVKELNGVSEEVETKVDKKIESLSAGDGVSPEAKELKLIDTGEKKAETKGDEKIGSLSVVDDRSEPESEEAKFIDTSNVKSVAYEVSEDVEIKGDDKIEASGVRDDVSEPKAEESKLYDTGGVKPVAEVDSIVDTIQVAVAPAAPGVAVVGGTQENGDIVDKPVEEVVAEEAVVEPGKFEVDSRGYVELTADGDTVVDTIQVEVVGPGVAVVGEAEQNGGEKIEGVDLQSSEPAAENTVDAAEAKKTEVDVVEDKKEETLDDDFIETGLSLEIEDFVRKSVELEAIENGTKIHTDDEVDEILNQLHISNSDSNDELAAGGISKEESKPIIDVEEIGKVEDEIGEIQSMSDQIQEDDIGRMLFGSSESVKNFIEELEQNESGEDSLLEQSRDIDGKIVTDSEEEGESDDDEGGGKELFDSAALASLLKAATGGDSNSGSITITSQDGSRLFSVERPAGLGSSLQSLRPAPRTNLNRPSLFGNLVPAGGRESEENLSEEEKKNLEKLQKIRVKFLRLVHRLGLSPEESMAAQVLYRLALLGGRQNTQTFSLDAAKRMALQLEAEEKDDLDFSVNILVLGKSGVGKSATINSLFGEEKAPIDAFENGTVSVKEISGLVDGVKVRVVDTPGLKGSVVEQGVNRNILSSVKRFTKKNPTDVVLYVDRLDAQSRDLNDMPLLKTVTSVLGSTIWRSAIVTLTHSASAPPDGPSGAPLSYEVFVSQRSHIVQQSIGHAVGDLRMMSPTLMNPVSLVENHPSCRKNRDGHKILPNGQIWRPQLLLLCYSMKILSEASSLSKPQDPFDSRKLFGFRARSLPLPYMLSSMLQSRTHPKLPSDQSGENGDSDIDLDEFSDSDQEEEDEYDQLPPFKPLKKAQIAKLSREQKNAYYEEFDYRVKLLQKKQWREELRRMREFRKRGNTNNSTDIMADYDVEADAGAAAPVTVPLPDMALPPSFDGDNPAYRYRFLEPTSQFIARPVLDTHGWDHDCGYDGVNLEHSLAILSRFPAVYTVQITKDKKDFTVSLDSSIAAKHGENVSSMAGFDIQSMGKQLAYIFRAETKIKNLKRNKATGGISFTVLGDNVVPALKVEDQINLGKRYTLVGSAGAVKSRDDTAYGANFEVQRREDDYPIGQVQSTMSLSVIKWRGDLALGFNLMSQLVLGRNSKVAVRAGLNNKMSGQITVRTSSSEHLSLALAAIIPTVLSVYKKLFPAVGENYSIY
ncbi:hypothetical protein CASFOL_009956 [Castilleja foliolosa]|uniref:AIG1-type G domain-containing protein n=1 Tax=Castilleja foliolosa TaxID=1961234 RepID=A0ABD3DSQ6_9LAMI